MLWLNIDLASCHSHLSCRPLSVTISPPLCLRHTLMSTDSLVLFPSPLLLIHNFSLCLGYWQLCYTCISTCLVLFLSEMLSRPAEDGFPDLVTVMRNLSTDSGMPPLPPGGGLASK